MKVRIFSILLFLLVPLCSCWSRGHIAYICFDPSLCNARPIVKMLGEWRVEGPLYVYIQKKDKSIQHIKNDNDFSECARYLRTMGISGARPSLSTIDNLNRDFIGILKEEVSIEDNSISIFGDKDESFIVDFILPDEIIKDPESFALIERVIKVNDLDSRCEIRIWESNSNNINQIQ